jgi:hypothetical protein
MDIKTSSVYATFKSIATSIIGNSSSIFSDNPLGFCCDYFPSGGLFFQNALFLDHRYQTEYTSITTTNPATGLHIQHL